METQDNQWDGCDAVERIPERVSGTWVFADTRVPVAALFENLEASATIDEFVNWFPGVTRQQAVAVLRQVQRSVFASASARLYQFVHARFAAWGICFVSKVDFLNLMRHNLHVLTAL